MSSLLIMVLKNKPDRPITVPIRFGHLNYLGVELASNWLNRTVHDFYFFHQNDVVLICI